MISNGIAILAIHRSNNSDEVTLKKLFAELGQTSKF
jgi:hypothetical protein